jgi:hypothetical protein
MAIQKPLKTERPPVIPIPKGTVPEGGSPYKVKNGDDWASVARAQSGKRRLTAQHLITYNFVTLDPAEVNYYLRVNVGCQITDGPRCNWKFSASADPGIIYIPPTYYDFAYEGSVIGVRQPLKVDWAVGLNDPSGKTLKIAVDIAKAVAMWAEVLAHSFVAGTVGLVLMPLATLLKLEGAHADAIASALRYQLKKGYSLGVVLGANGAKFSYVKNNFLKYHPVPHPVYDHIGKDLQSAFNTALIAGYDTARQLNSVQIRNLFRELIAHMKTFKSVTVKIPESTDESKHREEWKSFSDQEKRDFYFYAALAFEQLFLL